MGRMELSACTGNLGIDIEHCSSHCDGLKTKKVSIFWVWDKLLTSRVLETETEFLYLVHVLEGLSITQSPLRPHVGFSISSSWEVWHKHLLNEIKFPEV